MFELVAEPDDLPKVSGARQGRRSPWMRMPFANIAELMQGRFRRAANRRPEPDDPPLELYKASAAIFRLRQSKN